MSRRYNPEAVEQKWRERWETSGLYRFQPESAPAGQQNSMHLIGDVAGTEGIDLLRAAGAAAYVHAAYSALLAQDGGASGDRVKVREVPDANSRDVGKSFHN